MLRINESRVTGISGRKTMSTRRVPILLVAQLFTAAALAQGVSASPQTAKPKMTVQPQTAQVTATVAETAAQANRNPAKFDCVGPFTLSFTRVAGAGAPMVYDFTIEFTGANSARELGPGKCWRNRGWDFGPALSTTRKGVLIYRVDMGKCPFLESMTLENGRVTKYNSRERFMGAIWFDAATRTSGAPFSVEATYIGNGMNQTVPTPYAVTVAPDIATRAATCN
jgi:hypothetical protein